MAEPTRGDQGRGDQGKGDQGRTPPAGPRSTPLAPPDDHIFFVLEIANTRNRDVIWPLNQAKLRCRWAKENLVGVNLDEKMSGMPDVPGILISISGSTARIVDPLSLPENKALCERIAGLIKEIFGNKQGPEKPTILTGLHQDEIKSWCYWARRLLDNEDVVLRRGKVPEMVAVFAMPGLIRHGVHDSGSSTGHSRSDHRYIKPTREAESIGAAELDLSQIFDGR